MYIEYADYHLFDIAQLKKNIYEAIDMGVSGISVHPALLDHIKPFINEGIVLTSIVDFPYGANLAKNRQADTLRIIQKGVTGIDLVAPSFLLLNKNPSAFIQDILPIQAMCASSKVSFRVMIDYRMFDQKLFEQACEILKGLKIEYVYPSTGFGIDDIYDHIIMCDIINKKTKLNVIINGNIYLPDHYACIQNTNMFGVRFNNINSVKRCLVGV